MLEVVLDVETKKTFEEVGGHFPDQLGISFVGTCIRTEPGGAGEMKGFYEKDLPQLFELLEDADIVIGFNNDGFDMPTMINYYDGNIRKIPTLDLLDRIKKSCGHRISLDAVAGATFDQHKTGDGLDAIKYYREGRLQELADYCLQDVKLTRELYDYGLKNGFVKFYNKWNRLIDCPVDFTYTVKAKAGKQVGLF